MKKFISFIHYQFSFLLFCFIIANTLQAQNIGKYEKFEVVLTEDLAYVNPYDYNEVNVTAVFTSPSGNQKTVDGFFMQDYDLNETNGSLTPVGDGQFKVRFAPNEIGQWTYQVSTNDNNGSNTLEVQTFECIASTQEENKGYARTNNSNYLELDNGEQLILVGENMGWQNGNAVVNYRTWLDKLAFHGGNFIRVWHAHWGLGIEWENGWNDFEGLRRYKQSNSRYQDWLFDYSAENGVYIMLCLQHHGQVSSNVNPNWNDSPYNASNGGMCENTWDFFTNEAAKEDTKNRIRYIVARWGYARSIMAWELFNEVEWTDNYETHKEAIADWHDEMAVYIKSIDPYDHLVTTSYAHDDKGTEVWANPEMDITQTHFYNNVPNIERILAGGVQDYLTQFGKPTLTGEFGLGGSSSLANTDPDGIHIHNALWGALMSGGMGTAMTWWWDNYIHPNDLYYHFSGVAQYAELVPFSDKKMSPTSAIISGSEGDLDLTPGAGWGADSDSAISISQTGVTTPANPTLGQFLYGSQWNTELRNPPNFQIDYPTAGTFKVTTGGEKSEGAKITIWLDGEEVLDETASTNTTYEIIIPSGQHSILVDNTGIDWITIANYSFSNLGSTINAYVLKSVDDNLAAGWVLNSEYNHQFVNNNGIPDAITDGTIAIDNFENGDYVVSWFDCLTGVNLTTKEVTTANGKLTLQIPELYWDAAFIVDTEPIVGIEKLDTDIMVKMSPNPAEAGGLVSIQGFPTNEAYSIGIFDIAGKLIQTIEPIKELPDDEFQVNIPASLPTALYWLRIQSANKFIAKPLMIKN